MIIILNALCLIPAMVAFYLKEYYWVLYFMSLEMSSLLVGIYIEIRKIRIRLEQMKKLTGGNE